jgi:hypothetical protein
MCDRCPELEAEVEALRDQLHDVRVELADARSTLQAYRRHPTSLPPAGEMTGTCDWGDCDALAERWRWSSDVGEWLPVCWTHADLKRDRDQCNPHGIERPKLTVVR